jgi:predicted porin
MTGAAQISPGWSAGYVVHVEVYGSENLLTTNQDYPTGPSLYDSSDNFNGINTLQSYWFIKSEHLGKIGVGLQSQASDNTAILPDGSGSLVPANFVAFDYGGFFIRGNDGSLSDVTWFVGGCSDCNGIPLNNVRYDSPTWGGFSVSASWGGDDFWDVAARYAGELRGFKMSVAAAYSESSSFPVAPFQQAGDTQFFQIGAYVQHMHSGLWLYGAYGTIETDDQFVNGDAGYVDNNFWYIKGGLRRRWHPLGHTVMYGEYGRYDDSMSDALINWGVDSSETTVWGVGVVQEIDSAAMSMWLSYRHVDTDIGNCNFARTAPNVFGTCHTQGGDLSVEDFQYVKFGALINF